MEFFDAYHAAKQALEAWTGQSANALHIHAGLAIYLVCQVAFGTRRASLPALVIVLQVELMNEIADRMHFGYWRFDDTISDIAYTVFWPACLAAASKYRRIVWKTRSGMIDRRKGSHKLSMRKY